MSNTVLTMGSFDLLHVGHISLLRTCKKIAGIDGKVVVGINSSEFMTNFKHAPVLPFAEREEMVRSCAFVDYVFKVDDHDAKEHLEHFKPDFLVIGSDWAPPKDYHNQLKTSKEYLKEMGITLLYVERETEWSTTRIKEEVKNG